MLSLCFFDGEEWDYNVDAPMMRPFAGSQSAMCYLAVELAKLGHAVTLLSDTSKPGVILGVACLNRKIGTRQFFADSKFDAVIALNGPAKRSLMRWDLPASTMLMLWTRHAVDQPAMRGLSSRNTAERWDHIICVSDWQRTTVIETFRIAEERVSVARNAIAPAFEGLFPSPAALAAAKADGLCLAYTSTPFRGLNVLLQLFPAIRARHAKATLEVYSSMAVYLQEPGSDQFRSLYDAARKMAGVRYIGSLPQPTLATALAKVNVLSYPNTWAETSCIAVMEALAAGLLVVTSDLGALPETSQGFARLVPFGAAASAQGGPVRYSLQELDRRGFIASYRDALSHAIKGYDLAAWANRLYEQVGVINSTCTWRVRAQEWTQFLARVLRK